MKEAFIDKKIRKKNYFASIMPLEACYYKILPANLKMEHSLGSNLENSICKKFLLYIS